MQKPRMLPGGSIDVHRLRRRRYVGSAHVLGALKTACLLIAVCSLCLASGCQCCCCGTNCWSRVVDCVADHPLRCDCLYCAKLDATRINRPGGIQYGHCCRCEYPACCPLGVYAHRWMSPVEADGEADPGLQGPPTLPGELRQQGPYFPPEMPEDEAVPLFESPMPAPASSTDEDEDAGVVQMRYTRTTDASARVRVDNASLLVPVEVIFGN